MTLEQILEDIHSDRKKKVIFDSDTYNEMDDQYALAYTLGCKKMEVLGVSAALFHNQRSTSPRDGMEKSYEEIGRVMKITNTVGRCPVLRGCPTRISDEPDFGPVDSPASRFIIQTAKESDEIIYVMATGAITNVASAILMDPSIKEKICVLWIGGMCLECEDPNEFNLWGDYRAGQILMNSGVPLVMLPTSGDYGHGTQMLTVRKEDFQILTGDSEVCVFFRDVLPAEFDEETYAYTEVWERVIWDVAAPGVLSIPEAFRFSIRPAPIFADNNRYAFDSTRHKIIYMEEVNPRMVFPDMFRCIASLA